MRVLVHGTGQKGWSTRATCTGEGNGGGGCEAVLLVEQPDLYRTSRSDYGGGYEEYVTFKCCECGVETDLTPNNQPSHWIVQKLPTRKEKFGT